MTHDNHNPAAKRFAQLLGIAIVIVIANMLVNALALPHIELPDLPDVPGWIGFIVGKVKLIVLAIVILLAIVGEETARRRGSEGAGA